MDSLPIELLEVILSYLIVPDLDSARNVCKSWRDISNSSVVPPARRQLLELRRITKADRCLATIRAKTSPFITDDFDREAYIENIGPDLPAVFRTWVLETPCNDVVGWHWPGFKDEHSRERVEELGISWEEAMTFSRHMKPGYTLLPAKIVLNVEDPDYTVHNRQNLLHYAGSFQKSRPTQSKRVRALLIWADLSGYTPKITLLILDGSDSWDGTVWLTEKMSPGSSVEGTNDEVGLIWIEPLGSWVEYLETECKSLNENHRTLPQYRSYRSGGRVWTRQVHY
jgi:hypothetical protein